MNRRVTLKALLLLVMTRRLSATSEATSQTVGRMEMKSAKQAHSSLPDYYSSMGISYKATSSQIDESKAKEGGL